MQRTRTPANDAHATPRRSKKLTGMSERQLEAYLHARDAIRRVKCTSQLVSSVLLGSRRAAEGPR
jgi:hypothetical protein